MVRVAARDVPVAATARRRARRHALRGAQDDVAGGAPRRAGTGSRGTERMQRVPKNSDADGRAVRFCESRAALLLLLVLAAAVFAVVSLRPLTRSEFRYVEAGAEMAVDGDWTVPHLAYVPYFEKPILSYWVEA